MTVYRIMDFVREGSSVEGIATDLSLTEEQVRAALDYITTHRREVTIEYEGILSRTRQRNPPAVEAGRARSTEELKERINARRAKDLTHADAGG